MTLINRLIREAKNGATSLPIRDKHVSKIAQHALDIGNAPFGLSKESLEDMIRLGWIKIRGVPIVVSDLDPDWEAGALVRVPLQ